MTPPVRAMFAELLATDGVEEVVELRSRFGFLAFHGGLEKGTEVIAATAAARAGASVYAVIQPDQLRWHVPSHEVTADVSEKLGAFLDHIDVAVAVHGYGRPDRWNHLLLGGRNRELAGHLTACLRTSVAGYEIIDDLDEVPPEMRGLHPRNPVNQPRQGGVQLELPPRARGTVPPGTPSRDCTPVAGLVEALVQAATTWS